jgi:DNA polymerase III epsilon subunit-like protein
MQKEKQRYCSLDIETSGFDPLVNEILEVGFAFFELTGEGIKITEEFTRVFKPAKEVSPSIFGLTGITQEELDAAPPFEEAKAILQEKLGESVIVGHNVTFDIKFLESFGIKFSGQVVDTLDLVQFILPTHHSYNLENLMHTFRVSHKEAHRALADAKATLIVLENLLRIYHGYPASLKKQVTALIAPMVWPWQALLETKLAPIVFSPSAKKKTETVAGESLAMEPKHVYDFPLGENYLLQAVQTLKNQAGKDLLVVPKDFTVMELWKQGLVQGVFLPEMVLSEEKLEALLAKPEKDPDEVRFLLKVLVWKYTNWQHICLLDLNLSFFGGQFKALIGGGQPPAADKAKLVCCSQSAFCQLAQEGWQKKRWVVIEGLAEFEQCLSSGLATKVSWGYISYLLKSYYNPELNTGNQELKIEVERTLEQTDLFFGLAGAYFQNDPVSFQYVKITPELVNSDKLQRLRGAAGNFKSKLEEFAKLSKSRELKQAAVDLEEFFEFKTGKVHWLELGDRRCAFHSAPLEIAPLAKKVLQNFKKITFIDSLGNNKILIYLTTRLGLKDFQKILIEPRTKPLPGPDQPLQGDLFHTSLATELSGLVPAATAVAEKPKLAAQAKPATAIYHFTASRPEEGELAKLLLNTPLPAAALFGTVTQVKNFYDGNYQQLQKKAHLLANTHSGGSTKLFHNFSIDPNSILLVTDKFILKYLGQASGLEPIRCLPVKTLVIGHLPFEQFTHPYQEALSSQLANSFLDYSLPKAIYNLHRLLQFFNTEALEHVYLWDAKLAKGYGQDFKAYLESLSGVKVVDS